MSEIFSGYKYSEEYDAYTKNGIGLRFFRDKFELFGLDPEADGRYIYEDLNKLPEVLKEL